MKPIKKTFAVIGLGRFGLAIVKTLAELKCDVLAMDISEERVSKASQYINHCVICDSTKKEALKDLGISNVDYAIVAIGNCLQSTVLTTINLSDLGVENITVRADDEEHIKIMEKLGATHVMIPEVASAKSLANQLVHNSFLDYYNINSDHGIVQIKIPMHFRARTLAELDVRNKFDINIIGIAKEGVFSVPKGTDMILPGDIITIVGKNSKLNKFDQYFLEKY